MDEKQKLKTTIYSEKTNIFEPSFYENERMDIKYNVTDEDQQETNYGKKNDLN